MTEQRLTEAHLNAIVTALNEEPSCDLATAYASLQAEGRVLVAEIDALKAEALHWRKAAEMRDASAKRQAARFVEMRNERDALQAELDALRQERTGLRVVLRSALERVALAAQGVQPYKGQAQKLIHDAAALGVVYEEQGE